MWNILDVAQEALPGNNVLVISGYGSEQYVGRVKELSSDESGLPILVFEPDIERYQPRESTLGPDDICYWQKPQIKQLHLKPDDNVYFIGDKANVTSFADARQPINPEDPRHAERLTGEDTLLSVLYQGSELKLVV